MRIIIVKNEMEMNQTSSDFVQTIVAEKPDASLVLAMGNTPMGMYRELAQRKQRGEFDTSRLRIFQLDDCQKEIPVPSPVG